MIFLCNVAHLPRCCRLPQPQDRAELHVRVVRAVPALQLHLPSHPSQPCRASLVQSRRCLCLQLHRLQALVSEREHKEHCHNEWEAVQPTSRMDPPRQQHRIVLSDVSHQELYRPGSLQGVVYSLRLCQLSLQNVPGACPSWRQIQPCSNLLHFLHADIRHAHTPRQCLQHLWSLREPDTG